MSHISCATGQAGLNMAVQEDAVLAQKIAEMQKQFKVANISAARGKRYGVIEAVLSHPGRYMIGNSKYPLVEFSVYAAGKQAREKLVDLERRACHWRRC